MPLSRLLIFFRFLLSLGVRGTIRGMIRGTKHIKKGVRRLPLFLPLGLRICHRLRTIRYARRSRIDDDAENRENGKHRIYNGKKLVAELPEVDLITDYPRDELNEQYHCRHERDPKVFVFDSYDPVDFHILHPPM